MTSIGCNKPLYILPFDHRGSFQKKMFGWDGALSAQQTAEIAAAKRVIYEALTAAIYGGVPKDKAGIFVDEQFGAAILRDASADGYTGCCPAERADRMSSTSSTVRDFEKHIEAFHSTFCKVLVRYNAEGNQELNQRQAQGNRRRNQHYPH